MIEPEGDVDAADVIGEVLAIFEFVVLGLAAGMFFFPGLARFQDVAAADAGSTEGSG